MQKIYQPTTFPEWFIRSSNTAEFNINEIREILGCGRSTVAVLTKNLEEIQTTTTNKASYKIATGRKTAKRFSKQTVLELIESLPIKKEASK